MLVVSLNSLQTAAFGFAFAFPLVPPKMLALKLMNRRNTTPYWYSLCIKTDRLGWQQPIPSWSVLEDSRQVDACMLTATLMHVHVTVASLPARRNFSLLSIWLTWFCEDPALLHPAGIRVDDYD